jgi:alpha-1,6-mannosyltransferase
MRIVDVCAFYSSFGGGVKTYVRHKMRAGPRLGHEIIVLVPSNKPGIEIVGPGARIEYVEGKPFPLDKRYNYFHDEAALHVRLDALKQVVWRCREPADDRSRLRLVLATSEAPG